MKKVVVFAEGSISTLEEKKSLGEILGINRSRNALFILAKQKNITNFINKNDLKYIYCPNCNSELKDIKENKYNQLLFGCKYCYGYFTTTQLIIK